MTTKSFRKNIYREMRSVITLCPELKNEYVSVHIHGVRENLKIGYEHGKVTIVDEFGWKYNTHRMCTRHLLRIKKKLMKAYYGKCFDIQFGVAIFF